MDSFPIEIKNLCDEINQIFEFPSSYKRCNRFMIACCKSILDDIPEAAQKGLQIADQYWSGKDTKKNLTSAQEKCWEVYNIYNKQANNRRLKKSDNIIVNINKIRSVICVLYEKPEEDTTINDKLQNFFEFLYDVKDFSDDDNSKIIKLIYERFPEIPSAELENMRK